MKTFIIALVVLGILLTGVFMYSDYIKKVDSSLRNVIENIEKNTEKEEWNSAQKELKILNDIWKKDEKILAMFNDHEDLDKIKLEISELSEGIDYKNKEHSQKAIANIRVHLERLVKNESMSFENVLKMSQLIISCHIM